MTIFQKTEYHHIHAIAAEALPLTVFGNATPAIFLLARTTGVNHERSQQQERGAIK
jgi:hypothetical protein